MEVVHEGKKIPVVVAVSKPGLMFFLDRDTGKSVYPVEEAPRPAKATSPASRRRPPSYIPHQAPSSGTAKHPTG